MPPALVGIGGYAQSGKDALADALVTEHGYAKTYMSKPLEQALLTLNPTVRMSYRECLRWPAKPLFLSYYEIHAQLGYDESKQIAEVRRLLQVLGTEVGRNMFGPDVWLDLAFREIEQLRADRPVVITGIRFGNELARLREAGGLSVWVSRPGTGPVNQHSSENTLDPAQFDVLGDNSGSLADLTAWAATLAGPYQAE